VAADSAPAEAERATKGNPPSPSRDVPADGTAAAAGAPPVGGLGERLLRARTSVGPADDPAERHADQTADRVLRMPDPARAAPSTTPPPPPAPAPAPGIPEIPVMRAADPTPPQKVPGTPVVAPVGTGMGGGTGPETVTPAGPAPMVSAPVASGTRRAETGGAAVDAEPPAPEGEAPARETPVVPPQMQEYLDASRGKGGPLPEAVRTEFEARFQRPFDDVRVHDDTGSDDAARRIDALAFTRGNDIYFRSGSYDPSSEPGRHLLAHELAHVAQQRPGVNRKAVSGVGGAMIRRGTGSQKGGGAQAKDDVPDEKKRPTWESPAAGKIDTSQRSLEINQLSFPKWKQAAEKFPDGPYKWRPEKRPQTPQRENWMKAVRAATKTATTAKLKALDEAHPPGTPYAVKTGKTHDRSKVDFYLGTPDEIAEMILVPTWTRDTGDYKHFDVDHKVDWQLTGRMTGENDLPNIWLFYSKVNQAEGPLQANRITAAVASFMDKAGPYLKPKPHLETLRTKYAVTFSKVVFDSSVAAAKGDSWEAGEMGTPPHIDRLELVKDKDGDKELTRLRGAVNRLQFFGRPGGGRVKEVELDAEKKPKPPWQKKLAKKQKQMFEVEKVDFTSLGDQGGTGPAGKVWGTAFKGGEVLNETPFEVGLDGVPALPYGAVLTASKIRVARKEATGMSPVELPELEFDPFDGFVGRGKILPSVEMLKRVDVDIVLSGSGVGIEALITGDSLNLPGPFKVTGGMLSLYTGTEGVAVTGRLNFEIEKLATGYLQAAAGNTSGAPQFELEGALNFDAKMFSTATLGLSYKEGKWGVKGELVTAPKAIKGIKSGRATVEVTDGTVTAAGEFEPELKGLKKGTLGFRYNETTGMEITGEILLGEGIPGIKSGRMAATVKEGPDKHSLSGEVMIEPSIPGVTGNVTGRYDDGAFLVDASLGYEKDFAKGSIHLGVTNQAVGADGKPAGPPKPDGSLLVYGDGSVTLALTPWLKGTVGLTLKPNGEVEVRGEVALPPTFTVFDEKKIEKELLSAHVDIPIVGVSVLGQRIGIFATIGGSVSIDAGVGPGELRDTALRVTYNPARPEDTTVSGNATFAVPAHAALRLSFHGGLGVGIPVVSATAGLNVYGEVGVAGEASASTAVIWSPSAGVVLDASASIFVEPKFKFGIDAYVDVSADLWIKTIELYHETWKLAAFEYGSNLRFGLTLPVHYESGKPFELGFDQIQWTYPHIDPKELVSGLVEQLVS
jgi:hypothetical protein